MKCVIINKIKNKFLEISHLCYYKAYRKIVGYRKLDDNKSITVAIRLRKIFIDFFEKNFHSCSSN